MVSLNFGTLRLGYLEQVIESNIMMGYGSAKGVPIVVLSSYF